MDEDSDCNGIFGKKIMICALLLPNKEVKVKTHDNVLDSLLIFLLSLCTRVERGKKIKLN